MEKLNTNFGREMRAVDLIIAFEMDWNFAYWKILDIAENLCIFRF